YAIWRFAPALRVSIDGRREVYSQETDRLALAMEGGRPEGLNRLAALHPDYVWLNNASSTTKAWLAEHGYRIDVETPRSFVAARVNLPIMRTYPADETIQCFPGPL